MAFEAQLERLPSFDSGLGMPTMEMSPNCSSRASVAAMQYIESPPSRADAASTSCDKRQPRE